MRTQILFLTLSTLALLSCKEDSWSSEYYNLTPNTFSFKDREMVIEVSENTTSFFISATKEDLKNMAFITVEHEKSTAKHNFHYNIPKSNYYEYGFEFPSDKREAQFEVTLTPKNITEPVTITFYDRIYYGHNSNPQKYIDTLRVKLIPAIIEL